MVLIIPSSGCYSSDIMMVANQMMNIQYNRELFTLSSPSSNQCNCIKRDVKNTMRCNKTKYAYPVKTDKKFNVYDLYNEFDPSNPITIETYLRTGNIVVYAKGKNFSSTNFVRKIVEKLNGLNFIMQNMSIEDEECEFEDTEYSYNSKCDLSDDSDNDSNVSSCDSIIENTQIKWSENPIYKSGTLQASQYTMLYSTNNPVYSVKLHNKDISNSEFRDKFIWKIYIIRNIAQLNIFLQKNLPESSEKSKDVKSNAKTQSVHKFNPYLSGFYKSENKFNEYNSILYAPNTIILDAVQCFPSQVVKQLEYPNLNCFSANNNLLYERLIKIDNRFGLDYLIMHAYQAENRIDLFYVPNLEISPYDDFLSTTSWSCRKGTQPTMESPISYYLQYHKNYNTQHSIHNNYAQNISLCKQFSKKINKGNIAFLNEPDGLCFITGVPLSEFYYEIQVVAMVHTAKKTSYIIVVCMQVSIIGLYSLCISDNLSTGSPILIRNLYDLFKGSYEICNTYKPCNIIVNYLNISKTDVINLLKSKQDKELLFSISKFGMTKYLEIIYICNPEINKCIIGVNHKDVSDELIITMKHKSNYALFAYEIVNL